MKFNALRRGRTLRSNYREIIFVFLAFTLMVAAGNFSIGRILRGHLLDRAREMIFTAEANVRAGLYEAESILNNSTYSVQGMIEHNASANEILDYLIDTTEWLQNKEEGLFSFSGIYGVIDGEYCNGIGLNMETGFIPQTRPWYQTAVQGGHGVKYTAPYRDLHTGDIIFSAVETIETRERGVVGILSLDINMSWLEEYVGSLAVATGGYGILLNQDMNVMAYPDNSFVGLQFQDLGSSYSDIVRILRRGDDVVARRTEDSKGNSVIIFLTRIYNGWYIGITTPFYQFYRDLYVSALILVLLGLALSISLCYILLRLSAAKMRADEESKSKSSFLASMSHEIRTPINAVTGMAELLLRRELPDEAKGDIQSIKQAGANLISLINDILDFSKIEAGKLEIAPVRYPFSSLVNDTVNIIRMRLTDKPIRFYTNIDGQIPDTLLGDEVRIRQILLNLLSNAVKYTEKGHISLNIMTEKKEIPLSAKQQNNKVWLRFTVSDTGIGIKPEHRVMLFKEFTQIDEEKNRGIEGTGLGLAIAKQLSIAMGGDISVKSEYGYGTDFILIIPQGIESATPFARVEEPEIKKVLVYERRMVYAKSASWSLENMHVPHTVVTHQEDLISALDQTDWTHIFYGYDFNEDLKTIMEDLGTSASGRKPLLVFMVEKGNESYIPGVHFLFLPVNSMSIANILNGRADSNIYSEETGVSGLVRFTFRNARILVVDDIVTNLKVIQGLLAPYLSEVDTCTSGENAIEMVKQTNYDMVLMDHMMAGMDGVETTAAIRLWEDSLKTEDEKPGESRKQIPIVALTANAVSGMREMFLENGFNDFISKPIDVSILDEILVRWMPEEKKDTAINNEESGIGDKNSSLMTIPEIQGVNVKHGIAMTGGTLAGYFAVLSTFRKDVAERLQLLQKTPGADNLAMFNMHFHALKSAAASIGADQVSQEAAGLEDAGKSGDLAFISENLTRFTEDLFQLAARICSWESEVEEQRSLEKSDVDSALVMPILIRLSEALQSRIVEDIERILDKLDQKAVNSEIKKILDKVSDQVLVAEFDNAVKLIQDYIAANKQGK